MAFCGRPPPRVHPMRTPGSRGVPPVPLTRTLNARRVAVAAAWRAPVRVSKHPRLKKLRDNGRAERSGLPCSPRALQRHGAQLTHRRSARPRAPKRTSLATVVLMPQLPRSLAPLPDPLPPSPLDSLPSLSSPSPEERGANGTGKARTPDTPLSRSRRRRRRRRNNGQERQRTTNKRGGARAGAQCAQCKHPTGLGGGKGPNP